MIALPTLQAHGGTLPARYWTEFNALRDHCAQAREPRILSFGCSTGDELFTIRALFPDALIFGCDADADRSNLAQERASPWATVFPADAAALRQHGPFDVVIANSVLMDSGRAGGVDASAWLDVAALLIEAVRPGGILQIINSNIAFRLHPEAAHFTPLQHPLVLGSNFASQYALDGGYLAEGVGGLGRSAHLHRHFARERAAELAFGDLDDIHFRKGPAPFGTSPQTTPNLAGALIAEGAASYRPASGMDNQSAVEVDLAWGATADAVFLSRTARRVWFDGKVVAERRHVRVLEGPDANAFIENMTARPATPPFHLTP